MMSDEQSDRQMEDYIKEKLLEQSKLLEEVIRQQEAMIEELYGSSIQQELAQEIQEIKLLNEKGAISQAELYKLQAKYQEIKKQQLELTRMRDEERQKNFLTFKNTEGELNNLAANGEKLENNLRQIENDTLQIQNHTKILQEKLGKIYQENRLKEQQIYQMKKQIRQIDQYIEDCYTQKKKLNNELQELRGNIRVYCRIRPFLPNEDEQPLFQLLNENTLKLKVPKEHQKSQNHLKDHIFNFQQIFNLTETQQNVFNQLAQLIQSAIDGKNVCIFAYGQTGSGKTYTMQGEKQEQKKGIIPRSVELIFSEVDKAAKFQWTCEITVTIQEVYLETVRDLLSSKGNSEEVVNKYIVKSAIQIYALLEEAGKNRKVAETSCNQHSSRSHLIFTIHIVSRNHERNLQRRGSLNLVDLAGSQRVSLSKVQGQRMKQTQAINKSLTNLGLVISALAIKSEHIPFRNSKLTFLLQKYLQGDSKTLMFVNISPKMSDYNQTICSLRFAEKVKECRLKK